MRSSFLPEDSSVPSTSSSQPLVWQLASSQSNPNHSNVFQLLARREVSPRAKHSTTRLWRKAAKNHADSIGLKSEAARDARRGLISWVETESLQHLSAKYCSLLPPPRSTIAAAFSPDGKTLASTHGDHTVKIIDCQSGRCLKVLSGHRRTPWVVRFHPLFPNIIASGSLDQDVCLWDADTAACIRSYEFYRPIASIAFHAQGELLAVASGHKLYIWHFSKRGEGSSPTIILETRRSLRAVHFHPHAAPFLLTAEVNELESSDSLMTLATSPGYLHYPSATVYLADGRSGYPINSVTELPSMSLPFFIWPSMDRGDVAHSLQDDVSFSLASEQRAEPFSSLRLLTYSTSSGQYELLLSPVEPSNSPIPEEPQNNSSIIEAENRVSQPAVEAMDIEGESEESIEIFPFRDPAYWEQTFLQGWLMGQSQAGQSEATGRTGSRHWSSLSRIISRAGSGEDSAINSNAPQVETESQPLLNRIQSEIATSLSAIASAELPCTVKLRIWPHDIKNPCVHLDAEKCRLTIPHAVLCSEMGAHFSPCGRFLAACVACILPNMEGDHGFHGHMHNDLTGVATSPTRHPIASSRVMYELRIYSLEEATFGMVLMSRAIRAAHCLTSIQFSPTSEHLLLAYGRRHSSLLKSIVIDGEKTVPIYTILEVYRVSDMELVRVLPSSEDEVNVACFHPSVGGGLVYGTKEGKLRILQYDSSHGQNVTFPSEAMLEMMAGCLYEPLILRALEFSPVRTGPAQGRLSRLEHDGILPVGNPDNIINNIGNIADSALYLSVVTSHWW